MKFVIFAIATIPCFAQGQTLPGSTVPVLIDLNTANDGAANKAPDSANNYWNTISGTNNTGSTSVTVNNLVNSLNSSTGVSLKVSTSLIGGFNSTELGWAGAGANSTDPGTTVASPLNQPFAYTDGIYSNSQRPDGQGGEDAFVTFTFSGLLANTNYQLSAYGGRNPTSSTFEDGILSSVPGYVLAGDTLIENRTTASFNVTTDADGVLAFRWTDSPVDLQPNVAFFSSATINAISINVPVAVPEPTASILVGCASFLFMLQRRRSV